MLIVQTGLYESEPSERKEMLLYNIKVNGLFEQFLFIHSEYTKASNDGSRRIKHEWKK